MRTGFCSCAGKFIAPAGAGPATRVGLLLPPEPAAAGVRRAGVVLAVAGAAVLRAVPEGAGAGPVAAARVPLGRSVVGALGRPG